MAQWDQWLKHGSQQKEKFKSRHHDDFDDETPRGKRGRKHHSKRPQRSQHDDNYFGDDH
ncbi:hypothetical protein SAMN05444724_2910 [Salinivibrio sp. ES.052]|nr:hypothetical protein SAMN05444724_2910 [Salinivibrio sp. ES.052]